MSRPFWQAISIKNCRTFTVYILLVFVIAVKSRVLMSLRGEQDDLNWYELYGPSIPHSNTEKPATEEAPKIEPTNYGPMPTEVTTGKPSTDSDKSESNSTENTVEVVAVTVDGRFGQVNVSEGENLKAVLPSDIDQMIRIEGRVEGSADAIEV